MIIKNNLRSTIICCLYKSPVASAVFRTTLLEAVFAASIPVFVAVSINFLPYLSPTF